MAISLRRQGGAGSGGPFPNLGSRCSEKFIQVIPQHLCQKVFELLHSLTMTCATLLSLETSKRTLLGATGGIANVPRLASIPNHQHNSVRQNPEGPYEPVTSMSWVIFYVFIVQREAYQANLK